MRSAMSTPRHALTAEDIRLLVDDLEAELHIVAPERRQDIYASATEVLASQEVSSEGAALASQRLGEVIKRFGIRWPLGET